MSGATVHLNRDRRPVAVRRRGVAVVPRPHEATAGGGRDEKSEYQESRESTHGVEERGRADEEASPTGDAHYRRPLLSFEDPPVPLLGQVRVGPNLRDGDREEGSRFIPFVGPLGGRCIEAVVVGEASTLQEEVHLTAFL